MKTPIQTTSVALVETDRRMLTGEQFRHLAEVPAVIEWLANSTNPRTRRAYQHHVRDFTDFVGIRHPDEFRTVNRAHVIAWRDDLLSRQHSPATVRAKLSALCANMIETASLWKSE